MCVFNYFCTSKAIIPVAVVLVALTLSTCKSKV